MVIEEFYKTFGINKKCCCHTIKFSDCVLSPNDCEYYIYPKITDRILLELICIFSNYGLVTVAKEQDIESLKRSIIKNCIQIEEVLPIEFKHQVQALFRGEE